MALTDSADTIAAIATASGVAAVGVVRVSGPRASEIALAVVGRDLRSTPRRLSLASARDGEGRAIDQVLAVLMPGPASFTGEDVVELQGHGGTATMGALLAAVVAAGARPAEAGEFSRRAFENGRMDLSQAEGLLAVIAAGSERALRVGQALLAGELRTTLDSVMARCERVMASFEASIDFPEDVETSAELGELETITGSLAALAATGAIGQALSDGISVAIVGETNAGKSSLFNRLVGRERALVAPEPGTTRDFVEVALVWSGVVVALVDTAGDRAAEGLEGRGIALGRERAAECDFELVVVSAGSPRPALREDRQLLVWSKCDLGGETSGGFATSAISGAGLEALRGAILDRAVGSVGLEERVALVSARQRSLVGDALVAAERALEAARSSRPAELVAADLRSVRGSLAQLTGTEVGDEVLDALFAQFCIGK